MERLLFHELIFDYLQKPTRREVNICFVGYFEEKVLQMC